MHTPELFIPFFCEKVKHLNANSQNLIVTKNLRSIEDMTRE